MHPSPRMGALSGSARSCSAKAGHPLNAAGAVIFTGHAPLARMMTGKRMRPEEDCLYRWSLKPHEPAKLLGRRARRAKTVGRMFVIAVADGDGAEQHLFRRHLHERRRRCGTCAPRIPAGKYRGRSRGPEHQRVDIAAEIGPLAGPELALDGDEQRNRRIEEFEVALVLFRAPAASSRAMPSAP